MITELAQNVESDKQLRHIENLAKELEQKARETEKFGNQLRQDHEQHLRAPCCWGTLLQGSNPREGIIWACGAPLRLPGRRVASKDNVIEKQERRIEELANELERKAHET